MSRPRTIASLGAAVTALALSVVGFVPASATAAAPSAAPSGAPSGARLADPDSPLVVQLLQVSPVIPERGVIRLVGRVTNTSGETYQDINVLPLVSTSPMTSREELAAAAATDPTTEIGERITTPGQFDELGDLAPGTSRTFRIRVPRAELGVTGAPGVYWIGAHALGTTQEGRDSIADGRARTFIPLMSRAQGRTSVAVVLPVRTPVHRAEDGSLKDPDVLGGLFAPEGRLGRILDLAETAGTTPVTWLVDPAVLDAAADLAAGNPPLSFGEPLPEDPEETPEETPEESSGPTTEPAEVESDGRVSPETLDGAAGWLDRFRTSTRSQETLGLPYADVDVTGLARLRPALLRKAQALAQRVFVNRQVEASPAVAPPDGFVSDEVTAALDGVGVVIVSDRGVPRRRTQWATGTNATLTFADKLAASGGPGPNERLDALSLRQRILADAALRALDGIRTPMAVVLPADWDPGRAWERSRFFASLDQPWLTLEPLKHDRTGTLTAYPRDLPYPDDRREEEISSANVSLAGNLINLGTTYRQLLDTRNDVWDKLLGAALDATSYDARRLESTARTDVAALTRSLTARLDGVQVLGTEFVTLSGGSGVLTVSLVNDLPEPVRVGVQAVLGSHGVRIQPQEPVRIGPGQRVAVRLAAEADSIGVHDVELVAVTRAGREVGTPLEFNLRTSDVGRLIWIVLIAGAGLLAVMIARRIILRIRSHRWRQ